MQRRPAPFQTHVRVCRDRRAELRAACTNKCALVLPCCARARPGPTREVLGRGGLPSRWPLPAVLLLSVCTAKGLHLCSWEFLNSNLAGCVHPGGARVVF